MARRKRTTLLKVELESLLQRIKDGAEIQIAESERCIQNLTKDRQAYYYGRINAVEELKEFIKQAEAEYLES